MKDFWKVRCMLRKAQQGAKRPSDQLGVLGGAVSPPSGVGGSAPEICENPENLTHKKQYISDIF